MSTFQISSYDEKLLSLPEVASALNQGGDALYKRCVQESRHIWQIQTAGEESFILWSNRQQLGLSNTNTEIIIHHNVSATFASLSIEEGVLHVAIVVNKTTVQYLHINSKTLQTCEPLSTSWQSSNEVTQVLKVHGLPSLICTHPSSSGSKMLSLLEPAGTQWKVFAEIRCVIDSSFTHLNLSAISTASVVTSLYQRERSHEINLVVLDIRHILSLPKPSTTPLQIETGFLQCTLRQAVVAGVLDSVTVYQVPSSTAANTSSGTVHISADNIHFTLQAICVDKKKNSLMRFEIEHETIFDQIGKLLQEGGVQLYNSASSPSSSPTLSTVGNIPAGREFESCLIITPYDITNNAQPLAAAVTETQVHSFLFPSPINTIWEACVMTQAHLRGRDYVYAAAATPKNKNSVSSGLLNRDYSSPRYRQWLLMDASVATGQVETLVHSILAKDTHSQKSGNNNHKSMLQLTYTPYALENIQHVFDWVLGDHPQSMQQTLQQQLQQVVGQNIPSLLTEMTSPSGFSTSNLSTTGIDEEGTKRAKLTQCSADCEHLSLLAHAVEDISEVLYRRKMATLKEEQLVQGASDRGDIVFARDLASHSVAQLQCYRRLAQYQRQYVDLMQWLVHHPVFNLSAFQTSSTTSSSSSSSSSGSVRGEDMLARLHDVIPAIDERYLPDTIVSSASLIYERLCLDVLRTHSNPSRTAAAAANNNNSNNHGSSSGKNKSAGAMMMMMMDTDEEPISSSDNSNINIAATATASEHPEVFSTMVQETLLPLLLSPEANKTSAVRRLGDSLLMPMTLLYGKITHILTEQLYDGLSMQQLEDILDTDICHTRRVWLYLIIFAFVVAYKQSLTTTATTATAVPRTLFEHPFFQQVHSFFYKDGSASAAVYEQEEEEIPCLLALVLLDIDDVSEEEDNNNSQNLTHWSHAYDLLLSKRSPTAGGGSSSSNNNNDLLNITAASFAMSETTSIQTQQHVLEQYPYLSYLLEHVHLSQYAGKNSSTGGSSSHQQQQQKQTSFFKLHWSMLFGADSENTRKRFLEEESVSSLYFSVLQRLLCRGHYRAAYQVQQIVPYPRHIRAGVLAYIASIPETPFVRDTQQQQQAMNFDDDGNGDDSSNRDRYEEDQQQKMWQQIWDEARAHAEAIPYPAESVQTLQEMTRFVCRWTMVHGQFPVLLELDNLHLLEIEEIISFLSQRAQVELSAALTPSPALDALIGFLLSHRRHDAALQYHQQHVQRVRSRHYELANPRNDHSNSNNNRMSSSSSSGHAAGGDNDAVAIIFKMMEERGLLIEAAMATQQSTCIPLVDYNVDRNVRHGHRIYQQLLALEQQQQQQQQTRRGKEAQSHSNNNYHNSQNSSSNSSTGGTAAATSTNNNNNNSNNSNSKLFANMVDNTNPAIVAASAPSSSSAAGLFAARPFSAVNNKTAHFHTANTTTSSSSSNNSSSGLGGIFSVAKPTVMTATTPSKQGLFGRR